MRLRKPKPIRRFELEAGDELLASSSLGYLVLIKASGEVIDINQVVMDLGSTEACMDSTKQLNPFDFMQLASALAASYGLVGSSVMIGHPAFVVPITRPGRPSESNYPSEHALRFMANPQLPSLRSAYR